MTWKCDSFQGVLFTPPGTPQLDAQQAWTLVSATLPETVQRPSATPNALSIASGPFENLRLTIHSQLGRIDWFIAPSPPIGMPAEPVQFEDYEKALGVATETLLRALSGVRPVRVALVGEFGLAQPSEEEAAKLLSEQTDGIWFPIPIQDCIYQINARTTYAGDAGLEMNRIVTWSGSHYQLFTAPTTGLPMFQGLTPVGQTIPAASFKIDINSATSSDLGQHAEGMIRANAKEMLAVTNGGLEYLR